MIISKRDQTHPVLKKGILKLQLAAKGWAKYYKKLNPDSRLFWSKTAFSPNYFSVVALGDFYFKISFGPQAVWGFQKERKQGIAVEEEAKCDSNPGQFDSMTMWRAAHLKDETYDVIEFPLPDLRQLNSDHEEGATSGQNLWTRHLEQKLKNFVFELSQYSNSNLEAERFT